MLLAIDTATRLISLALHDGQDVVAEQTWTSDNHHSEQLAPAIRSLLTTLDRTLDEITALAVCVGPGSYTGLRIGVALAKGLASARALPLVGVTSLDILAASQPYAPRGTGLIAVVQAGRGRIIAQSYRWNKTVWQRRTDAQLMTWARLLDRLDGPAIISGEIDANGREHVAAYNSDDRPLTIIDAAHRLRRAGFLAEIAWERLNETDNPRKTYAAGQLIPIYLKSESVDGKAADDASDQSAQPAAATPDTATSDDA